MSKTLFNIPLFILSCSVLALSGCSKSFSPRLKNTESAEITIRTYNSETEGLNELIQDFNQIYPSVKISLIQNENNETENADLYFGTNASLRKNAAEKAQDLSKTPVKTNSINSQLIKTCKNHGKTIFLPLGMDVKGVYLVNKTVLAKNGITNLKTNEDFLKATETFSAKGIVPVVFKNKAAGNYFYQIYLTEMKNNSEKGKFLDYFNSDSESAALYVEKYFTELNTLQNRNSLACEEGFKTDSPFTYVSVKDFRSAFASVNSSNSEYEYRFFSSDEKITKPAVDFYSGFALNKNAQNKKWAEEFLRFAASPASLNKYAEINCIPTSAKKNTDSRFDKFFDAKLTVRGVYTADEDLIVSADRLTESLGLYADKNCSKAQALQYFCKN